MRQVLTQALTLSLLFWFATTAPAKPGLELSDDGLPLQELRPLDRRVYVLTLDGKWKEPASSKLVYYINFLFPDGGSYAHKVDDEEMFRKGDVRCIIQGYQLARHGISKGGKFSVVVSEGKPVKSAQAAGVVSDAKEIIWPMERRITRFRPHTKHMPPEPVDEFPIPGEEHARPPKPSKPPSKKKTTKLQDTKASRE